MFFDIGTNHRVLVLSGLAGYCYQKWPCNWFGCSIRVHFADFREFVQKKKEKKMKMSTIWTMFLFFFLSFFSSYMWSGEVNNMQSIL